MGTAAMVLCAGYGTRLRPLTDEMPKALAPVGDRPALAHALTKLSSACETVAINLHHLAEPIETWGRRSAPQFFRGTIGFSRESAILGTAGGLANAAALLGQGPVLVWNADVVAWDLDVVALLSAFHRAGADAVWVVSPAREGQGTVGLDVTGAVVRLRGQRFGKEVDQADYLGIQVVSPALRARLPPKGCLVGDLALPLLAGGGRIATMVYAGPWDDVGSPTSLHRANMRWLDRTGRSSWVAAGAEVEPGVELERSIVNAGAKVDGAGVLRACVVCEESAARAPAADCIFGPSQVLAVGAPR